MTIDRLPAAPASCLAALLFSVLSLASTPCSAEEAIATASQAQPAPAPNQAVQQIAPAPPVDDPLQDEGVPDRRPHGVVEIGVGTGGYRHAAGVVTAPVGETGQITVAVEKTDGRVRWR